MWLWRSRHSSSVKRQPLLVAQNQHVLVLGMSCDSESLRYLLDLDVEGVNGLMAGEKVWRMLSICTSG